ncbi:uncharacterized protein LOC109523355 isoform X2 [Hippocampus comes]|uniref:uncharacterized protein LOC109523355 isoform X1 n=1 Tax=Hippocampus comes TaxID=109280 RepID=UPI00094E0C9F|nr:PREDICTED: uncharacterized protein LOC109523355 isoform X1 [Hippocampus comes]XP_019738016.1 PREDICTED: uncharacterized protein LOC109523355 isoform X2 [Hippocampus comes]
MVSKGSEDLIAVRLPLASTWRAVWPPNTITAKPVMLEDLAGDRSFSMVSPDSVTCTQCKPAFNCEEHGAPVANLPLLVFTGKCQFSCMVLDRKHNHRLWTSGPHTTLMESVSDRLSRHMHICGLLEVILQGSGSAPPVSPCTKAAVAVLLLGCCPATTSSTSPDVLAYLLVAPPCSRRHGQTQQTFFATPRIDVPSWMSCILRLTLPLE